MKLLMVGLLTFGFVSGAQAAGINCKNEAAGHALNQMISEVVKAGKLLTDYKFRAGRPVTDDSIDLKNGDVFESYDVTVYLYKGSSDYDIDYPLDRSVRVEITNTKSGACKLIKTSRSVGE
ncbi:hypothetical protein [Bdellovibrio sp. HCB209]|uniref:hypothetical protein n=1 Tax=Bdellovibrio sp. HCB209 TaxID=3394354 RepID=UPI0039B4A9B5